MSVVVSAFPPPPPTGGQPVDVDDEIDGIIEPPPEIRLIADKTAQYVVRIPLCVCVCLSVCQCAFVCVCVERGGGVSVCV